MKKACTEQASQKSEGEIYASYPVVCSHGPRVRHTGGRRGHRIGRHNPPPRRQRALRARNLSAQLPGTSPSRSASRRMPSTCRRRALHRRSRPVETSRGRPARRRAPPTTRRSARQVRVAAPPGAPRKTRPVLSPREARATRTPRSARSSAFGCASMGVATSPLCPARRPKSKLGNLRLLRQLVVRFTHR